MVGLLILVVTFLIAVGACVLALKLPQELQYWKLIAVAIAIGSLLGAIFYLQQMRAIARADQERSAAIAEASNRAVYETSQRVTQEIGKRYEQQIKSLTKQVVDLEAQLPNQGANLGMVGTSNGAAGAGAPPNDAAKLPGATPSIFWIQADENVGRGTAEVQFRVYGPLNVPAFIAVCDRPCRAVGGQAGPGSEGIDLAGSADRDVAGFLFKKPKPMPAGTEGTITVQSSDRGAIKVTAFRILRESEVPAGLK